jgi:hypothetical protein
MAGPPAFLKKAAKRRMDAALPSNAPSNPKKGGVATFANPGNKAGAGLLQQRPQAGAAEEASEPPTNFLSKLASAPTPKKQKTKVQPAANRKLAAMRLANLNKNKPPMSPMNQGM